MFIGHIGAMDAFARGLRNAARIKKEGLLPGMVKDRYKSFNSALGKKLEKGKASLEDFEKYAIKHGEPKKLSGK
jgi:xylose isomerase